MQIKNQILVGIDDTDLIDTPGTNKLALHLVNLLRDLAVPLMITRHQLLTGQRVPCTKKNGCAAIRFEINRNFDRSVFLQRIRTTMLGWCPAGSDPGLCLATADQAHQTNGFGLACQIRLISQQEAYSCAMQHQIHLEGLGGTNDGVIGALAAVGLQQSGNDGRVIYAQQGTELFTELGGICQAEELLRVGVDEIRDFESDVPVIQGRVELGKKLRANLRDSRIILFVQKHPHNHCDWQAVKLV